MLLTALLSFVCSFSFRLCVQNSTKENSIPIWTNYMTIQQINKRNPMQEDKPHKCRYCDNQTMNTFSLLNNYKLVAAHELILKFHIFFKCVCSNVWISAFALRHHSSITFHPWFLVWFYQHNRTDVEKKDEEQCINLLNCSCGHFPFYWYIFENLNLWWYSSTIHWKRECKLIMVTSLHNIIGYFANNFNQLIRRIFRIWWD